MKNGDGRMGARAGSVAARRRSAAWSWTGGATLLGVLAVTPALFRVDSIAPTPGTAPGLALIATHSLSVSEPSDLAIDESGTILWTVSDRPGRVHRLALDGKVVQTLKFVGEDLEGIAYDRSDRTLWVAEENRREIVHLDLDGNVLSRHPLGLTGETNSGIEAICLDAQGRMFAMNEKNPGLLLELNANRSIAIRRKVTFAGDYSGMTFDRRRDCFWIVSDQSQGLYLCNRQATVMKEYRLPFPKAEGIAVDAAAGRIYIVSDSEKKLYVYRLEG